ncbi:amino acid adenylation domain-containing protein, partial [Streptomyces sp. SID6139]|nr:AMP-binding protein [Streptomyces sp. SID6139]
LLTHATLAPSLELGIPALLLDQEEPSDGPLPDAGADPQALAYVSHTSGSTGEPSAVLVEHASLDAYLRDTARAFGLGADTVALQTAPLGYDASIRDTFVPLLAGARLVIVDRARLLRPAEFAATVRDHGVTALLSVTPSFLTHLGGQTDLTEPLAGVELVASSGESLRPFLAAGGRGLVPGRLVNQYGPTECTMTTTRHSVPAVPDHTTDLVGTPREGTVVRILDGALAPVPDGTVGEVYIGGTGVTRGYGGQPARTAAAFVPDPLGPPGARLYRTGDLGRRGPGGLHYTGRTDRQLKIRGYRVDPAEIEGALLSHPGVTGAVVTPHTDDLGRVHLLAHVTGALSDTTDATLRRHLARTLPPHLMPRRFVRLETLPTTRGGKADRRVLAGGRPV